MEGRHPLEEAKVASTFLSSPGVYCIQGRRRQESWAKESPHSRSTSPRPRLPSTQLSRGGPWGVGRRSPQVAGAGVVIPGAVPGEVRS